MIKNYKSIQHGQIFPAHILSILDIFILLCFTISSLLKVMISIINIDPSLGNKPESSWNIIYSNILLQDLSFSIFEEYFFKHPLSLYKDTD